MSYLVYDIEVQKIPYDGKSEKKPDLEYASGWTDYGNLGISIIGAYSSILESYLVFGRGETKETLPLEQFEEVASGHVSIVGFNSLRFDDLVLHANNIKVETTYDVLLECWAASGLDPNYYFPENDEENRKKYAGYKLDTLAIANFGRGKIGSGTSAPALYQKGEFEKLNAYCLEDVRLTHELFKLGLRGELWHPKTRKFLQLSHIKDYYS